MGRVGVAQPEFWGREGGGQWQGRGSSDQEERGRAALSFFWKSWGPVVHGGNLTRFAPRKIILVAGLQMGRDGWDPA